MYNLLITIGLSSVIIVAAIALLGIGWLLTGKQKVKLGMCGRDPHKERDSDCGSKISCSICGKQDETS